MRIICLALLCAILPLPALAADTEETSEGGKVYTITMKNHQFSPLELVVPADQDITIVVKNEDTSPFEFESPQLKREKIIQPADNAQIKFAGLKAGTYKYYDDFNRDAKGFITVK